MVGYCRVCALWLLLLAAPTSATLEACSSSASGPDGAVTGTAGSGGLGGSGGGATGGLGGGATAGNRSGGGGATGGGSGGGAGGGGICIEPTASGLPCCLDQFLSPCATTASCVYQTTSGIGTNYCYADGVKIVSHPAGTTGTAGSVSKNGIVCYTYTTMLESNGTLFSYSNAQGDVVGTALYATSNQTTVTCTGQAPASYPTAAPTGQTCTAGTCS